MSVDAEPPVSASTPSTPSTPSTNATEVKSDAGVPAAVTTPPPATPDAPADGAPAVPPVVAPGVVSPPLSTKPKIGEDTVFTGELLRQIRESQRITLKEISERTRISVANLSALESERYEDLPNARVYVRGFVRCLAVEIGLDRDHVSRTYVPRWEAWFSEQSIRR